MGATPEGVPRNGVQVIHRMAAIMLALRGESGLSLAEIAQRVGLARSTVHRLVSALESERFVVAASPYGGFRLGPALASLAATATRDLKAEARRFLVELAHELNETVDLAVLEHDRVLFVDQVAGSTQRLRAVSSVGSMFPVHCTANGKALLSALPNAEIERLLPAELERLTPSTITTRARLLEEVERVRADGVAYDREEHTTGICAVGTVLERRAGQPFAAVTVPLPAQRFYGSEDVLADALLRKRTAIDAALRAA